MDSVTKELLRTAPGLIGDTARNYSNSFKLIVRQGANTLEDFNKAFFMTIIRRSLMLEITGKKEGNLLIPIYSKGVEEIHRVFDKLNIGMDDKHKLDLPTMTLYSMLLESEYYRITFEKADDFFRQSAFQIIHQEIVRICPYQVKFNESEFVQSIPLANPFIFYSIGQHNFAVAVLQLRLFYGR